MKIIPKSPATLGEKLAVKKSFPTKKLVKIGIAQLVLAIAVFAVIKGNFLSDDNLFNFVAAAMFFAAVLLIFARFSEAIASKKNFLLAHDKQGFVGALRLKDKTAIVDGSNIYHFGLDHRLGTGPLRLIAHELRSEGYRIVCFFDANIFFTLRDNDNLPDRRAKFSTAILKQLFAIDPHEIYIVPAGKQADKYVLETLSHLPISFAVTNDRFRDYQDQYAVLSEHDDWRKGVTFKKDELFLHQHKFKNRIRLQDTP